MADHGAVDGERTPSAVNVEGSSGPSTPAEKSAKALPPAEDEQGDTVGDERVEPAKSDGRQGVAASSVEEPALGNTKSAKRSMLSMAWRHVPTLLGVGAVLLYALGVVSSAGELRATGIDVVQGMQLIPSSAIC